MRRRRVPLHRSLLTRLLAASVLVAVCAVAATTWLAVATTTRAIRTEDGQLLADDQRIYDALVEYAAEHQRWDGVQTVIGELAERTGRVITLTTTTRIKIASSVESGPLAARPSAVVDSLQLDPALADTGAGRIDARAVGPFRLPPADQAELRLRAGKITDCLAEHQLRAEVVQLPSGRVSVRPTTPDIKGIAVGQCGALQLSEPTKAEEPVLAKLSDYASVCAQQQGGVPVRVRVRADYTWFSLQGQVLDALTDRTTEACIESGRRQQLRPYVAPPALLFVSSPGGPDPGRFELSSRNTTQIAAAAALVLAVTVFVTVLLGVRLVRPLRGLIAAAQRPAGEAVRVPVRANDEIGYLAAAFNDLTDRRESLEKQRKSMVSDVAHELRTPLTNIRSWLEAAQDGLTPPDREFLALLLDEALLLQHVIDDLRDLAAADSGNLALHQEQLPIRDVLDQVVSAQQGAADEAGVRVAIQPGADLELHADPLRLRQVVGNLLSNAIRHTPRDGQVTLRSRPDGDDVVIEVADTGAGIAATDLPHVFDRFWRAEKSRNRQSGGSGIGLAIARKLAEAHGGTITAASPPGQGAVFTIRLPRLSEMNPGKDDQVRRQIGRPPGAAT